MTIRLDIEPGGESWLLFAKERLKWLKQRRADLGINFMQHRWATSDGAMIHLRSHLGIDTIKITVSGGRWDFVYTNYEGEFHAMPYRKLTGIFGDITKQDLVKKRISDKLTGVFFAGKTARESMGLFRDDLDDSDNPGAVIARNRFINGLKQIRDYEPTNLPLIGIFALAAEDNKIVANAGFIGGYNEMTDGTTHVAMPAVTTSGFVQRIASATRSEGYMIIWEYPEFAGYYGGRLKIVSLSLSDVVQDVTFTPVIDTVELTFAAQLANYTDIFVLVADVRNTGTYSTFVYRQTVKPEILDVNGVVITPAASDGGLDYTFGAALSHILFSVAIDGWAICTKDGIFGVGILRELSVDHLTYTFSFRVLVGIRNVSGTYDYSESGGIFDTSLAPYAPLALGSPVIQASADDAFLFIIYQKILGDLSGYEVVFKIFSRSGQLLVIHPLVITIAFQIMTSISFASRACAVVRVFGEGINNSILFVWSDGEVITLLIPLGLVFKTPLYYGGSQSVAYTYWAITDFTGNESVNEHYFASSDGALVRLFIPPPIPATDTTPEYPVTAIIPAGFVEKKVGCALLFTAHYVGHEPTIHHWTEDGTIFNYSNPGYDFAPPLAARISIPLPSAIHRMRLIEQWAEEDAETP